MAPPTPVTRVMPTGIKLPDGYRSMKAFSRKPGMALYERGNKPPGIDTGDPIDTSTMLNNYWRTMAGRALRTLTPSTIKCGFDPAAIIDIIDMAGVPQTCTDTFGDGSTLTYYCIVKSLEFDELVEGTFPTLTITVVPTNTDPVTRAEAAPVISSVAGT